MCLCVSVLPSFKGEHACVSASVDCVCVKAMLKICPEHLHILICYVVVHCKQCRCIWVDAVRVLCCIGSHLHHRDHNVLLAKLNFF